MVLKTTLTKTELCKGSGPPPLAITPVFTISCPVQGLHAYKIIPFYCTEAKVVHVKESNPSPEYDWWVKDLGLQQNERELLETGGN